MIRVEPFDPATADEATALAWAGICADWSHAWAPRGLPPTPEWLLTEARNYPAHSRRAWSVAYDGDVLLGGVALEWHEVPDNRDRAFVQFEVPPAHARDDVLAALFRAAAAVAEPAGRTLLNVYSPSGSAVSDWLRARGATLGAVEEVNVTRFDRLDRADVAALAAAAPAGYDLVRFDGRVPDELIGAYADAKRAMNDAPRDDLTMEDWTFTPERHRDYEAAVATRGHRVWTVAARHTATGEVAAFNELLRYPDWPEVIENDDTGVVAAHRGHGLGLWVKAVNLLRAADTPDARCVLTWNAASNTHMLRVNRRLGFACEHVWDSWEIATATVS